MGSLMQPKPRGFTQGEREFWAKLNDFVRENGGWTTSQPDVSTLTFQCEPSSDLPALLTRKGFDVIGVGDATRLLPSTVTETRGNRTFVSHSVVPTVVSVYS